MVDLQEHSVLTIDDMKRPSKIKKPHIKCGFLSGVSSGIRRPIVEFGCREEWAGRGGGEGGWDILIVFVVVSNNGFRGGRGGIWRGVE